MRNQIPHSVSKVIWDIGFDTKEGVNELQSSFSYWSRFNLGKEMDLMFSRFCPNDQVWQIERLELDLGVLDIQNLDNDLPNQFREALLEKLRTLALLSESDQQNILVIDGDTVKIQQIESYLTLGYFTKHQSSFLMINDLFLDQLLNNQDALLEMVLKVAKSKKVRKRMAWQLETPTIQQLIGILEPNNQSQLFEFVNDFNTIQKAETIVQTSLIDFKKNLWFWVLNHLFDERGTLFNRLNFMESSIRQMAAYYNIEFGILFKEIEEIVLKLDKTISINSEFITTIKLLSKQQTKKNLQSHSKQGADYRIVRLKEIVKLGFDDRNRQEIDHLMIVLSKHNSSELFKFLNHLKQNESSWNTFVQMVPLNTLSVIIQNFSQPQFKWIEDIISLFSLLTKEKTKSNPQKFFFSKILVFMLQQPSATFNQNELMSYLLSVQKVELGFDLRDKIKTELDTLEVSELIDNGIKLKTYHQFLKTLKVNSNASDLRNDEIQIQYCIKYLFQNINEPANFVAKNKLVLLEKRLKNYVKTNPKSVLNELKKHKNKVSLKKLIDITFTAHEADVLLKIMSINHAEIMLKVQIVFNEIYGLKKSSTAKNIIQNLTIEGLVVLINKPRLTMSNFLKSILLVFRTNLQKENQIISNNFNQFLINREFNDLIISYRLKTWFKREFTSKRSLNTVITNITHLQHIDDNKLQLVTDVLTHVSSFGWSVFLKLKRSEKYLVFNFLVPNGISCFNSFLKYEGLESLDRDNIELRRDFEVMFWKYVFDITEHSGNIQRLEKGLKSLSQIFIRVLTKDAKYSSFDNFNNRQTNEKIDLNFVLNTSENISLFCQQFEQLVLENPGEIVRFSTSLSTSDDKIKTLQKKVNFNLFVARVFHLTSESHKNSMAVLHFLNGLTNQIISRSLQIEFECKLWKVSLILLSNPANSKTLLRQLFNEIVDGIIKENSFKSVHVARLIEKTNHSSSKLLKVLLNERHLINDEKNQINIEIDWQTRVNNILSKKLGVRLLTDLINEGRLPHWICLRDQISNEMIFNYIIESNPFVFLETLKLNSFSDAIIYKLFNKVLLDNWFDFFIKINPHKKNELDLFKELLNTINRSTFSTIESKHLVNFLFKKAIVSCQTENWSYVLPNRIWKEMAWHVTTEYGVQIADFLTDIESRKTQLPTAYQFTLAAYIKNNKKSIAPGSNIPKKRLSIPYIKTKELAESIHINNAGIVLISGYIKTLFERLKLIEGGQFLGGEHQEKGIHFLQYAISGVLDHDENFLVLNKILCGLPIDTPISRGTEMKTSDISLIEGMINAIISHWPSIGKCSIEGFRGNWLIRDGILQEEENRWNLTIEKKAYDLLINKSPFSFSIIKNPWMEKPIHVNWPY